MFQHGLCSRTLSSRSASWPRGFWTCFLHEMTQILVDCPKHDQHFKSIFFWLILVIVKNQSQKSKIKTADFGDSKPELSSADPMRWEALRSTDLWPHRQAVRVSKRLRPVGFHTVIVGCIRWSSYWCYENLHFFSQSGHVFLWKHWKCVRLFPCWRWFWAISKRNYGSVHLCTTVTEIASHWLGPGIRNWLVRLMFHALVWIWFNESQAKMTHIRNEDCLFFTAYRIPWIMMITVEHP